LSQAIDASPHLRHTLMWNGERTPVDENLGRELRDGDELYLLGPVAGG
jgi:molybdopterin converting factor small subunit